MKQESKPQIYGGLSRFILASFDISGSPVSLANNLFSLTRHDMDIDCLEYSTLAKERGVSKTVLTRYSSLCNKLCFSKPPSHPSVSLPTSHFGSLPPISHLAYLTAFENSPATSLTIHSLPQMPVPTAPSSAHNERFGLLGTIIWPG